MIKSPGTGKKTGRRQQNPPRSSRRLARRRKSRPDGEEKSQRLQNCPRLRDFQRQKSQKWRLRKRRRNFPLPRDRRNRQRSLEITDAAAGGNRRERLRQPEVPREPWPLWRQRGRKTGENLLYWLKMAGRAASPGGPNESIQKIYVRGTAGSGRPVLPFLSAPGGH